MMETANARLSFVLNTFMFRGDLQAPAGCEDRLAEHLDGRRSDRGPVHDRQDAHRTLSWPQHGAVYGAAGSPIVMLLWVYYSAQVVFFGAEFTKVYARRFDR